MKINTNKLLLVALFFVFCSNTNAQISTPPKTVVTIVVDQMRAEYLNRFYAQFGENGFKRLMNGGFNCHNVHNNYIPTYTGPGHTSIFTGSVPRYHGIIGNSWYDRDTRQTIYCTNDSSVKPIGCTNAVGQQSARQELSSTIADELEIYTQKRSLTYSISLKDRAAILSAGHMADGVFWYDNTTGNFVSSSYYVNDLPEWLKKFNAKKLASHYMQLDWNLALSPDHYKDSYADENAYEHPGSVISPIKKAVFPYHLAELGKQYSPYDLLIHTPWGNTLLADLAIETISNVAFGEDEIADILMISFSSTDAIGHLWGPQSKEIEDTYIRLDADIARILETLDKKLGKDNYLLALTADHGVGEVSQSLIDNQVPSGYFSLNDAVAKADSLLDSQYGQADWVEYARNHMIYFNYQVCKSKKVDIEVVSSQVAYLLTHTKGVAQAFTANQLLDNEYNRFGAMCIQNGFNPKRSGDVLLLLEPSWTGVTSASSDHGSQYTYDTNIPLLWYGNGVAKGESVEYQQIIDIAPTICQILKIKLPNSTFGKPVKGVWFKSY